MPDEKESAQPAAPRSPQRRPKVSASSLQEMNKRFEDAYYTYMRALQEISADFRRASEEAYCNYLREIEDEYRNYLNALQDAQTSEEPERRLREAHQNYSRAVQEAYRSYWKALRDTQSPDETEKRLQEAYRNYLRALQDAWAQIDADALDTGTLVAISRNLMAAVSLAEAARTIPRQRWQVPAWSSAAHPTYGIASLHSSLIPSLGYVASSSC